MGDYGQNRRKDHKSPDFGVTETFCFRCNSLRHASAAPVSSSVGASAPSPAALVDSSVSAS
jgi:hypothetical protein